MTLSDLKTGLAATGLKFAHHAWSTAPMGDYGVFAEDRAKAKWANNKKAEEALQGTVDYFTRDASGTPKQTVEAALDGLDLSYYLNSVQYEADTGYVHYEWVFELG